MKFKQIRMGLMIVTPHSPSFLDKKLTFFSLQFSENSSPLPHIESEGITWLFWMIRRTRMKIIPVPLFLPGTLGLFHLFSMKTLHPSFLCHVF